MISIQTLNKFHNTIENSKNMEFINSIYNQQPPNNCIIPYLFYINRLVQKYNKNVLVNTLGPHLFLEQWTSTINHA
jgi:hypothetical protein